jgi:hypothetical protein
MTTCCTKMESRTKILKSKTAKDHAVIYDNIWRVYAINWIEEVENRDREMSIDITFCPWCGTKLPVSLSDDWFDILEDEYDIEDPSDEDRKCVPPEFQTDEWWRKRGL